VKRKTKEQKAANAEFFRFTRHFNRAINGKIELARHRRDFLPHALAGADKYRIDHRVWCDARFPD
jgi:hypothetical protein